MASPRKRTRIVVAAAVTAAAVAALVAGIGTADAGTKPKPAAAPAATWTAPPANAGFDYQIGQPYTPPSGVTVVSRDYTASPAAGLYSICYVNAFQTQPDAASWWQTNHPDLLLRDADGNEVIDEDWNEILLDYSTAAKRTALTAIVGQWIDTCATKGFKAVEPDNLDSYTRSGNLLTASQAVAYATSLSTRAHTKGLAIAQKNDADLSTANAKKAGFDFAVAEECADWNECDAYTATYGNRVFVIEYDAANFKKACASHGSKLSIVQRDRDVTAPGSRTYVFKSC
ncbi:endo alpha-1,4 polygalactosaminidase [Actinoplanes sp. TFC3]|uniref:endo alpha-1,4 polygalactosaminidase n=1 Tax=Actinoplanes sp. TFC3 TaxID=1710355 RepID=UPI00082DE241|nr:endo alpha-1,4 polygalactosaminidase [Actinoplanes sp. TFC3]